jgi:hypothetical protein
MTSPYPERSPFPHLGTLSVEGTRIEPETGVPASSLVTLPLEPLVRVHELAVAYLARYRPADSDSGAAVMLHGDHGAGKTHAVLHTMQRLAARSVDAVAGEILQLYVKAEDGDFLALYRRMMPQVPLEQLQDASYRFLAVMAGEQIGSDAADSSLGEEAIERLRQRPRVLERLVSEQVVEVGAVQDRRTREVERIVNGRDDFRLALRYLNNAELGAAAYDWLVGRDVAVESLQKMGIAGPLASAEDGRWGLQLLATLFGRVGRPLVIYIDQYEKLILSPGGQSPVASNVGILHSLVEVVPRESGMFVLSGNEDAYEALPKDLIQRFGTANVVGFPALDGREARALIRQYRHPETSFPDLDTRDAELLPFCGAAIDEIMFYARGNTRRVLQLSADVYTIASARTPPPVPIRPGLVRESLRRLPNVYFDRDSVLREVEEVVREVGSDFERDYELVEIEASGVVTDFKGLQRLVVEVQEARYHDDEARNALRALLQVLRLESRDHKLRFVFVAVGYVSAEIAGLIERFVDALVVYQPETFRGEFARTLRSLLPEPATPEETGRLREELLELRQTLADVVEAREAETKTLDARLRELLERQAAAQLGDRLQAAMPAWIEERRSIDERVRAVRAERRDRDLEELARLTARAERERRRRNRLLAVAVASPPLIGFIVAVANYIVHNQTYSSEFGSSIPITDINLTAVVIGCYLSLVLAAGLVALFVNVIGSVEALLSEFVGIGPRSWRELREPVGSLAELDRLGRGAAEDAGRFRRGHRFLLNHQNPQFRYAAALVSPGKTVVETYWRALVGERATIVRRKLTRRIGSMDDRPRLERVVGFAEKAHLVEAATVAMPVDLSFVPRILRDTPAVRERLSLVVAFASGMRIVDVQPGLIGDLATSLRSLDLPSPRASSLARAFQDGLERGASPALAEIPVEKIRHALQALSPFDDDGLGTVDDLACIDQIDRFHIFFQQLLFSAERDILPRRVSERPRPSAVDPTT